MFFCSWALVKDKEIAKKMTEFIVLSTIGVSKESQLRAAKILQVLSDSHEQRSNFKEGEAFFDHSYSLMARRWKQLRDAVKTSELFSLPDFPLDTCTFSGRTFASQPGEILSHLLNLVMTATKRGLSYANMHEILFLSILQVLYELFEK